MPSHVLPPSAVRQPLFRESDTVEITQQCRLSIANTCEGTKETSEGNDPKTLVHVLPRSEDFKIWPEPTAQTKSRLLKLASERR